MDYFRFHWRGIWFQIPNEELKNLKVNNLILMPNGQYTQIVGLNPDNTPKVSAPDKSNTKIDISTDGYIKAEYSTGFVDEDGYYDDDGHDDDDDDNYDDYDDDDDYFEDEDGN